MCIKLAVSNQLNANKNNLKLVIIDLLVQDSKNPEYSLQNKR